MASRFVLSKLEQPPPPSSGEPPKTISYEDMNTRSEIPLTVWKASTDPKLWDMKVDVIQPSEAVWLTTYFAWLYMEAIWFKLRGKPLHNTFREEFIG